MRGGKRKGGCVFGHTDCGAVKGAIANPKLGKLTGLLSKLEPAITGTAADGDRSDQNRG